VSTRFETRDTGLLSLYISSINVNHTSQESKYDNSHNQVPNQQIPDQFSDEPSFRTCRPAEVFHSSLCAGKSSTPTSAPAATPNAPPTALVEFVQTTVSKETHLMPNSPSRCVRIPEIQISVSILMRTNPARRRRQLLILPSHRLVGSYNYPVTGNRQRVVQAQRANGNMGSLCRSCFNIRDGRAVGRNGAFYPRNGPPRYIR